MGHKKGGTQVSRVCSVDAKLRSIVETVGGGRGAGKMVRVRMVDHRQDCHRVQAAATQV